MATEVTLPALGESVTEGTVTRWLKQVGDSVAVDEPLLEVSTDKVDTEIPSPVAGTLLEIKANEDDTVEVGAVLAIIGDEGESAGDAGDSPRRRVRGRVRTRTAERRGRRGRRPGGRRGRRRGARLPGEAPSEQAEPEQARRPRSRPPRPVRPVGGGTAVTLPALGE